MSFGDNINLNLEQPVRKNSTYIRIMLFVLLTIIALCALLLCFTVTEIECEGNSIYTDKQVIDAAGISIGENLVTIQKAKAAGRIMTSLPFVESVHIERKLPNKIIIHMTEAEAAFVIAYDEDGYYLINSELEIKDYLNSTDAEDYPVVYGIVLNNPEIGKNVSECSSNSDAIDLVMTVFKDLNEYGLTGGIREIDVSILNDLQLNYDDRYTVYLGTQENLEYKISYLAAVIRDWDEGNTGDIDLTFEQEDRARYQPK